MCVRVCSRRCSRGRWNSPLPACHGTPPSPPLLSFRAISALAPVAAFCTGARLSASSTCGTHKPHALSPRHNRSCLLLISGYDQTVPAVATAFPSGCCGRKTSRAGRMRGCETQRETDPSWSLPFSSLLCVHPCFPLSEAVSAQCLPALPGPQRGLNNSHSESTWEPYGTENAAWH